ncbi:MAG: hypothetical protein MjAS7_1852 [Metallosphaera javensis (ex Sakai et al. 2022)]|nr:MAG: hypothetical protein MjAS7_1852 [Metallosphaera javensis (ex Sakai et al. 2022)]
MMPITTAITRITKPTAIPAMPPAKKMMPMMAKIAAKNSKAIPPLSLEIPFISCGDAININ